MNIIKTTFLFIFITTHISCAEPSFAPINFDKIKLHKDCYSLLVGNAKRFRKIVYISGAGVAVSALSYLIYRLSRTTVPSEPSTVGSKYSDFYRNALARAGLFEDMNLSERCKNGFFDGISDGVYYGTIGVIASLFLAIKTKAFDLASDAFWRHWTLKDENLFIKSKNCLELMLLQLRVFALDSIEINKDEVCENYRMFIEAIENLLGLICAHFEETFDSENENYLAITKLQNNLCKKVNEFSEHLKLVFSNDENENLKSGLSEQTLNMFKQLNNQILRFINLCQNLIYEVSA